MAIAPMIQTAREELGAEAEEPLLLLDRLVVAEQPPRILIDSRVDSVPLLSTWLAAACPAA